MFNFQCKLFKLKFATHRIEALLLDDIVPRGAGDTLGDIWGDTMGDIGGQQPTQLKSLELVDGQEFHAVVEPRDVADPVQPDRDRAESMKKKCIYSVKNHIKNVIDEKSYK